MRIREEERDRHRETYAKTEEERDTNRDRERNRAKKSASIMWIRSPVFPGVPAGTQRYCLERSRGTSGDSRSVYDSRCDAKSVLLPVVESGAMGTGEDSEKNRFCKLLLIMGLFES